MSKTWKMPVIVALDDGGNAGVIGGGTGQAGDVLPQEAPCNYSFWLQNYKEDTDQDGIVDEYDFYAWWRKKGFSYEDWMQFASEFADLWDDEP